MKLPNVAGAVVPQTKITDYPLSLTHRDGRHRFFRNNGQEQVAAALEVQLVAIRRGGKR